MPTSHRICSPGSAITHWSSVFSSHPLPAFPLSVTRPQAVPVSQVLSQMRLFSLAPYFRRTAALTSSAPLREGLTEQWLNEQRPNVPAPRNARWNPLLPVPRDCGQVPACPPTSKSRDSVASAFQNHGNRNTHLAPAFTLDNLAPAPVNVATFRGLLGPGGFNSLYQMSFQQWNRSSPCGPRTSRTPLCSWGITFPTRTPPGIELWSWSLCAPLVYSLNGI